MSNKSILKFESKRLNSTNSFVCRSREVLDEIFPPEEFFDRFHHRYVKFDLKLEEERKKQLV